MEEVASEAIRPPLSDTMSNGSEHRTALAVEGCIPGDRILCFVDDPETGERANSEAIPTRRDGRVVDGGGLENHCTGNGAGGSNPSPSASSIM